MKLNTKVGLFVFSAFVIMIIITMRVKRIDFLNKTYDIYTYYDNVAGLKEGSTVRLAGVKIGFVKDVIPKDNTVKVIMSIYHRHKIQSDAIATILMETLMAGKCVSIDFGQSTQYLQNNDFINSGGLIDIESLIYNANQTAIKAGTLIEDFNKNQGELLNNVNNFITLNSPVLTNIIANVDEIIEVNKHEITDILVDVRNTTRNLNRLIDNAVIISDNLLEGKGTAGKILSSDELYNELTDAIATAKLTFEKTNNIIDNNEENVSEILEGLKVTIPEIQASMTNIKKITDKISTGEGTIGKLIMDEELYNETKDAIKGINKAMEDQREQTVISTFADFLFGTFAF